MGDWLTANQTAPSTPAAGFSDSIVDATTKRLVTMDDAGVFRGILSKGASVASQALGSAADTYITNSFITVPSFGMQASQLYRWIVWYSQTATTQTLATTIRIGTNKSTGDTSVAALTATVTTGATAAGGMLVIYYNVQTIGASGTGVAGYHFNFANGTIQSGTATATTTFDNTTRAGQFVGLSINPSGTVGTILGVHGECIN